MLYSIIDKQRILDAARQNEKWQDLARILSVNYKTAWKWVAQAERSGDWEARRGQHGGARRCVVTEAIVQHLVACLEANCQLTLRELVEKVHKEFRVTVSQSAIRNALDGRALTLKRIHHQPEAMNDNRVKLLRRAYLIRLLEQQSQGKLLIYMDETNYNVWCGRTVGRAPKNKRAVVRHVSKGPNMHVIACVSAAGLVYWERRHGAFRNDECNDFVRRMFDHISRTSALRDVVLVVDNAPCHSRVEQVLHDTQYAEATILRLGPYSPMLNPIENVFSAFKSAAKQYLAARRDAIRSTPDGMTQREHLASFLEQAADELLPQVVTSRLVSRAISHTLRFHVAALEMQDMPVGE